MARTREISVADISVLAIAEQYLQFLYQAHKLRLELAANYLVMAARLTYLESCMLSPQQVSLNTNSKNSKELAQRQSFRLMQLNGMRCKFSATMT
ncbi:MAG: segregation/condensation protein A [Hyphomicrobiaceae bacterium]|nr:segregation/condensation protein A [Hyphomicrobiaceae bacterium]